MTYAYAVLRNGLVYNIPHCSHQESQLEDYNKTISHGSGGGFLYPCKGPTSSDSRLNIPDCKLDIIDIRE